MTNQSRSSWASSFGLDPAGYDRGRPDYPERVYDRLQERCGLGPGTSVFEIGPGSGIATRALLGRGVAALTAIEPDARLAAFLESATSERADRLTFVNATFAEADLPEAAFDLGVAATTLHWLDPLPALTKVFRLLRPGGWWAMWWTIFGNALGVDAFHEATLQLFPPREPDALPISVSEPFALDAEARLAELAAAGFIDGSYELIRWSASFDVAATQALYATFPHIRTLPAAERTALLDQLGQIVRDEFAGAVERALLTPLYMARRPEPAPSR